MRKLIFIGIVALAHYANAASYTEFYIQPTGDNLNAGSTTNDAAVYSATGGNFTNDTSASVCTWYKSGENLSSVVVSDWASVYPDGLGSNVFVGSITAVDDSADTITISLAAKAGTKPATSTGGTSIKVGGAWKGPNIVDAADESRRFPFNFATATLTNTSGNTPCLNFLGTYSITNGLTHALAGPIIFSGYTNTPRDGGFATINGPSVAVYLTMVILNNANIVFQNFIVATNGNSGTPLYGLSCTSYPILTRNVIVHDIGGYGLITSANTVHDTCEVYNCGLGQNSAGIRSQSIAIFKNCISRNNSATGTFGISAGGGGYFDSCIIYSNKSSGINATSLTYPLIFNNCEFYGNGASGLDYTVLAGSAAMLNINNCNFFKNGAYGIKSTFSTNRFGFILNCAFGSGTQTNASGWIDNLLLTSSVETNGCIIYPADATPWVDPTNGNFTAISGAFGAAKGISSFLQSTVNPPTNTVSYRDIGAAQAASTNVVNYTNVVGGAGGAHSHSFMQ